MREPPGRHARQVLWGFKGYAARPETAPQPFATPRPPSTSAAPSGCWLSETPTRAHLTAGTILKCCGYRGGDCGSGSRLQELHPALESRDEILASRFEIRDPLASSSRISPGPGTSF